MKLKDLTLGDFKEKIKEKNGDLGGGGVCSSIAVLASALTIFVYNLSKDKDYFSKLEDKIKIEIEEKVKLIDDRIVLLENLIDQDGKAFNEVIKALSLPKKTDIEIENRQKALKEGYKKACNSPFQIADAIMDVMKASEIFSIYASKNAITDVATSFILNYAALDSCLYNVEINLKGLDDAYRILARKKVQDLRLRAGKIKNKNLEIIRERM